MQSINYQRKIEIGLEEKDARIIVYFTDSEYLGFCKRIETFFPFLSIKRREEIDPELISAKKIKKRYRREFESVPGKTKSSVQLKFARFGQKRRGSFERYSKKQCDSLCG